MYICIYIYIYIHIYIYIQTYIYIYIYHPVLRLTCVQAVKRGEAEALQNQGKNGMGEFSYCCSSAQNTHEKWL